MLSIENCKKVLQQNGKKYSEEEVKKIRQLLYKLGELDYQLFNAQKTTQNANSYHLHKGIN